MHSFPGYTWSSSATLQAWAIQPRGWWGPFASNISEKMPTLASLRCLLMEDKIFRALAMPSSL